MASRFFGSGALNKCAGGNQWTTTRMPMVGGGWRIGRDTRRAFATVAGGRSSRTQSPQTTDRLSFNGQRVHTGWPPVNY